MNNDGSRTAQNEVGFKQREKVRLINQTSGCCLRPRTLRNSTQCGLVALVTSKCSRARPCHAHSRDGHERLWPTGMLICQHLKWLADAEGNQSPENVSKAGPGPVSNFTSGIREARLR